MYYLDKHALKESVKDFELLQHGPGLGFRQNTAAPVARQDAQIASLLERVKLISKQQQQQQQQATTLD